VITWRKLLNRVWRKRQTILADNLEVDHRSKAWWNEPSGCHPTSKRHDTDISYRSFWSDRPGNSCC
jgi:lambda repressor-like predicted transcriptional regulator